MFLFECSLLSSLPWSFFSFLDAGFSSSSSSSSALPAAARFLRYSSVSSIKKKLPADFYS
jgi:hypothetical protein